MNRRLKIGLNLVLALIVAAGAAVLVNQQINWRGNAQAQDKAAQVARFTPPASAVSAELPGPPGGSNAPEAEDPVAEDPVAEELAALDLAALQAVNPDVLGWIYIPGTEISHPLCQGTDNDYYLKHTWEKKWNSGGSIFLDWRCSRELEDFNTVIYGHRMNNGSMFAPLRGYKSQDFWQEHPSIYVLEESCVRRYEIFAAWEPSVTSAIYTADCDTPEKRQELVDLCLDSSELDTGVVPGPEDKLLTLSTCTGNGHATRWVVNGVLVQVYERAQAENAE